MSGMRQQAAPNLIGTPAVDIRKREFDSALWTKGYDVIIEKALRCPCAGQDGQPLSSCQNCKGLGWVFVNPIETRAVLQSMNDPFKFRGWSLEKMNQVHVIVRDVNRLAYLDRITVLNATADISENLPVKIVNGESFCYPSYEIRKILTIFIYQGSDKPLLRLKNNEYSYDKYKLVINHTLSQGQIVSVRYSYSPQFNVLESQHDIRTSKSRDKNGVLQDVKLPNGAVAQRSHTIFTRPGFSGDNVFDNSWL